jgi:ELWxxDGT repeat protein
MRLRFLTAVLLLCLAPAAQGALTPRLVKDISTGATPADSSPSGFATAGGVSFFAAADPDTGREIWRTDGTATGTYRLADICPGECSSGPIFYAIAGNSYFFRALGAEIGGSYDLWVSGGTPASTLRLTDSSVLVAPDGDYQRRWVPELGLFFFLANDFDHGSELWRTDGTPAGTYRVADLRPGREGSRPREMTAFNGRLYFVADDGARGPMLWKSDGTAAGTVPVRDPIPSSAAHDGPSRLRAVGRSLYFVAPAPGKGVELWKSNGTTRGTAPLADLTPGPASTRFYDLAYLGDRLYFVADTGAGQELWTSNGTAPGTRALTQFLAPNAIFSSEDDSQYLPLTSVGGRFAFVANDGAHGFEMWKTDGTPKGTVLVKDVCPGACSGAGSAQPFGNRLVFLGTTPARGTEPWITDGTAGGTRLLRDLCPGACSSFPYYFVWDLGGRMIFATDKPGGLESQLWSSNGTTAGTVPVATFSSLRPVPGGIPIALLGHRVVFAAKESSYGIEPWTSDGTAQGTTLLADINRQDLGGSGPSELNAVGSSVFFFAGDAAHGAELWKSDGSGPGTTLVHEFVPGPGSPRLPAGNLVADQTGGRLFFLLPEPDGQSLVLWRSDGTDAGTVRLTPPGDPHPWGYSEVRAVGGTVFFVNTSEESGPELWKTDGTAAGTVPVKEIYPDSSGSDPRDLTAFQGRLFFTAETPEERRELWVSDGTAAGTRLLKDVNPEPGSGSEPGLLTPFGGRLWFAAADASPITHHLWSTDGTSAGTVLMDLVPGSDLSVNGMAAAGSHLFFFAGLPGEEQGLWVTDGTAAGTRRLADAYAESPFFSRPAALGGTLFFAGSATVGGSRVLWTSDGTAAGTGPLLDRDGNTIDRPSSFQVLGGVMFFSDSNGGLWQSDGTSAGTFKVRGLVSPGASGSVRLVRAGNRLFFPSFDRATGTELWAIDGE